MLNFIIWIIVGGLIGWVASIIMHTNAQQGILLNVIVGIVGAFVAGYVLTPLLGIGTINQNDFSLPALLVSLGGAVILLFVVSLFRGGGRSGSRMRITQNLGMLLLAIWLILTGLSALLSFSFQGLSLIMGILALAAGILILLGR
jgi:uncharacterized membrane protein YeaQ/YmgE (transglycosylase-associated protein family)